MFARRTCTSLFESTVLRDSGGAEKCDVQNGCTLHKKYRLRGEVTHESKKQHQQQKKSDKRQSEKQERQEQMDGLQEVRMGQDKEQDTSQVVQGIQKSDSDKETQQGVQEAEANKTTKSDFDKLTKQFEQSAVFLQECWGAYQSLERCACVRGTRRTMRVTSIS